MYEDGGVLVIFFFGFIGFLLKCNVGYWSLKCLVKKTMNQPTFFLFCFSSSIPVRYFVRIICKFAHISSVLNSIWYFFFHTWTCVRGVSFLCIAGLSAEVLFLLCVFHFGFDKISRMQMTRLINYYSLLCVLHFY